MGHDVRPVTGTAAGDFAEVLVEVDGMRVGLLTLGAATRTVEVPDRRGDLGHVHLHLPTAADHADAPRNPHLGATVGRYANRIGGATFELDGATYRLDANNGPNTLHGGHAGFSRRVWDLVSVDEVDDRVSVVMRLSSADGDMGFPGAVVATATYTIEPGRMIVAYRAVTDAPTVISLAHHGYWNLAGSLAVGGHHLAVIADELVPVDAGGIPTGGFRNVAGTPFDLREGAVLAEAIVATGGIDHCYAIPGHGLRPAALVTDPTTGRHLRLATDAPGVQVYTANSLGEPFAAHASISLEPQRYPDAPNHPELGPCVLGPGEEYTSTSTFDFGAEG